MANARVGKEGSTQAMERSAGTVPFDILSGLASVVRSILGVGILLVLVGGTLGFLRHGRLPTGAAALFSLPGDLLHLNDAGIATLGILVLLAAPPVAVICVGVCAARNGQRLLAGAAGVILGVVVTGLAVSLLTSGGRVATALPRLDVPTQAGVLAAAGLAGGLGVSVGLGGAVFLVPVLSAFFGVPMKVAISAGAVSVVVNSLSGTSTYLRDRIPNIKLGLLLELTTVTGAVLGSFVVVAVAPQVLRLIFAVALLGMAVIMVFRRAGAVAASSGPDPLKVGGMYRDRASGSEVRYIPRRLRLGAGAGFAGGMLSGMLGIGGGVIKMPVMHGIMGVPVKAAAATSVFMVGITVSASAYIYYAHGIIDLSVAVPAALGIQVGSWVGARVSGRLSGVVLVRFLAAAMVYLAVVMFLQALGGSAPGV